jgi:hypothetical protein
MPVVINEFEVMPRESNPNQEGQTTPEAAEKAAPSARDIAQLLQQQAERDERVSAH